MTVSSVPSSSSSAFTVTAWAVPQLDVVNVRMVLFKVTSVLAWPDTVTVTSSVGWVNSHTE